MYFTCFSKHFSVEFLFVFFSHKNLSSNLHLHFLLIHKMQFFSFTINFSLYFSFILNLRLTLSSLSLLSLGKEVYGVRNTLLYSNAPIYKLSFLISIEGSRKRRFPTDSLPWLWETEEWSRNFHRWQRSWSVRVAKVPSNITKSSQP